MYLDKKRIIIVLVVCIFLFFFIGCSKPKYPKLTLSEDSWYYGEVRPDEITSHLFVLKNEGENKLIIESVYSSCACISLELDEKEIPPGEETFLKTIFDPYGYEDYIEKTITIKSNDPEQSERKVDLSITVLRIPHPEIEISQQTFDLGMIDNLSGLSILQFTIANVGDMDLIIEDIVTEEIFSYSISLPLSLTPEEEVLSEIYLDTSQLKEGVFRKAVRIMSNDPQNPIVFLRITGTKL